MSLSWKQYVFYQDLEYRFLWLPLSPLTNKFSLSSHPIRTSNLNIGQVCSIFRASSWGKRLVIFISTQSPYFRHLFQVRIITRKQFGIPDWLLLIFDKLLLRLYFIHRIWKKIDCGQTNVQESGLYLTNQIEGNYEEIGQCVPKPLLKLIPVRNFHVISSIVSKEQGNRIPYLTFLISHQSRLPFKHPWSGRVAELRWSLIRQS